MMVPVFLKTSTYVEPRAGVSYLITADGTYVVRDTPIYRSVTRLVGPIPGLLSESQHVRLRFPCVPRPEIEDVLALFDEVFRRFRGEAMVLVFYDQMTRRFRIEVPEQVLPARRRHDGRWLAEHTVVYGTVARPAGMVRLGSIHSHGAIDAYSSAQDCVDERYEDGLHIVFGGLDQREPTVAAAFVADGVRFALDPAEVLEPFQGPASTVRTDWLARVTIQQSRDGGQATGRTPVVGEVSAEPEDSHESTDKHERASTRHDP